MTIIMPTTVAFSGAVPDSLRRCEQALDLMLTHREDPSGEVERVLAEDSGFNRLMPPNLFASLLSDAWLKLPGSGDVSIAFGSIAIRPLGQATIIEADGGLRIEPYGLVEFGYSGLKVAHAKLNKPAAIVR